MPAKDLVAKAAEEIKKRAEDLDAKLAELALEIIRIGPQKADLQTHFERGFPSQVKGAGLRALSRRRSRVRIPSPALLISIFDY